MIIFARPKLCTHNIIVTAAPAAAAGHAHARNYYTFRGKYAKCVLHRIPVTRGIPRRGDRTGCNSRGAYT